VVCKLLESNINIDQCNNAGTSALFMACQNGYLSIVSKLLEYKADVNKSDHGGFSPLYVSCQQGFIDIVCKLLDTDQCLYCFLITYRPPGGDLPDKLHIMVKTRHYRRHSRLL
jgi:hypothetical protein